MMAAETVCCEWCGDEFKPDEMETTALCQDCAEVADDDGDLT